MSLDIGAIVGISVAAAAVAVLSGKFLFRKKHDSPSSNLEALNEAQLDERTQFTADFLNDRITATEFRQKMSSVGRGKGKKTKKRKSSKKRSYKKK